MDGSKQLTQASNILIRISREDLGQALHGALRVCCESTATFLAYNIIHILDDEAWSAYLDLVWELLDAAKLEDAERVVKRAANRLALGDPGRNALRIAVNLFDAKDCKQFLEYVWETGS